jgi:chromosome segregation ATPase
MSDNAEFEKLSTLEARLAAALDRIAVGLGEGQAAAPTEDPGITSAAFEDALIRAETAEARARDAEARLREVEAHVADLESHVAELAAMVPTGETPAAQSGMAELEAMAADLSRRLAESEARAAALEEELAAAAAAVADPRREEEIQRLTAQVSDLEARVTRLRAERSEAIAERDEARDIAEELQAAGGMGPDDRNMALRAEVQELRTINERLTKNLARLRGENATDPTVLNKALVVELDALKAARASEAAELERILADLDRAEAGEGAHA